MKVEPYDKGHILTIDDSSERDTGTFTCRVSRCFSFRVLNIAVWPFFCYIFQVTDVALRNATHVRGPNPGLRLPYTVSMDIEVLVATSPKIEVFPASLTIFKGEKVGSGLLWRKLACFIWPRVLPVPRLDYSVVVFHAPARNVLGKENPGLGPMILRVCLFLLALSNTLYSKNQQRKQNKPL